jgi:hypothetical protein
MFPMVQLVPRSEISVFGKFITDPLWQRVSENGRSVGWATWDHLQTKGHCLVYLLELTESLYHVYIESKVWYKKFFWKIFFGFFFHSKNFLLYNFRTLFFFGKKNFSIVFFIYKKVFTMEIFEWEKIGKKKYSKLSSVKNFYYGNFWMRKNWEKKVFKIVLSKKFLLYKKNNGKIFWDEKKQSPKIPLFFLYSKNFLLRTILNTFFLFYYGNFWMKKNGKKSIQNCPQ